MLNKISNSSPVLVYQTSSLVGGTLLISEKLLLFSSIHTFKSAHSKFVSFTANELTIASMLSISPETLSCKMNKLEKAGLIKVNNKEITIINVAELRNFSENYDYAVR